MVMLDFGALAPDTVHPFSRQDYERLVELGLFREARVELLRGVVVSLSPQGPWHAVVSARVHQALLTALGARVFVMSHSPLPLSDADEPEPDVAAYPPEVSAAALPTRPYLVVEVSDTSLSKDRGLKRDLYAEAGVPEYWVVRRDPDGIEVYTQPEAGCYQSVHMRARGSVIRLVRFPEVELRVDACLPPTSP